MGMIQDGHVDCMLAGGTEATVTSLWLLCVRQQVVRVAWSVEESHVVQRSHKRLSLIQWIVWFSSPVCGKTDVRSDSH